MDANETNFLGTEEKNGPGDLSKLKAMIESMQALDKKIQDISKDLDIKKQMFNKLSEEAIPFFLNERGLSEIRLESGEKVIIKENVYASIKDSKSFNNFLRERNEEDISKYNIVFDRMESKDIKVLTDFLVQNSYSYKGENKVHPMTLKKYFRELLGIDKEPKDIAKGIQNGSIVSRETIESFANVYTKFNTKIK